MPRPSLRRRVLGLSVGATLVLWTSAAWLSYQHTRREIEKILDAHLVQTAAVLAAQAGHDLDELEFEHVPALHPGADRVAFQVWDRRGRLRAHAPRDLDQPLSTGGEGFHDEMVAGRRWRVFCHQAKSRKYRVLVAERADARARAVGELGSHLLRPLVVAVPLLALILWWAVRRGLQPLEELADEVARRAPDQLAPLDTARVPDEVRPLVERLNALLRRVADAIRDERQFTADAAHELRTPIAAIRAQAQVARNAVDDASRSHALDGVITGCDRAARLVAQLLTLERIESSTDVVPDTCDLAEAARRVMADLAPAALARGVQLELVADSARCVRASASCVEILLQNLLDNAIRYSPADTTVSVRAGTDGPSVRISVIDQGRGIPPSERANVWRRFHRLVGSVESGSGLGLSIVARIVELHSGTVRLGEGPGGRGTCVEVVLPAV